jgi:hypothetical protein
LLVDHGCKKPSLLVQIKNYGGKSVSNKSLVCDDWIDVTLGIFTLSGTCVACLLVHGAVADKNILVHPESRIAVSSVVAIKSDGGKSQVNAN